MNIFRSIKIRLLVFILCISLIPIVALTTLYYLNARKALKEHTLTWMKEVAVARKNHVIAFMDAKKERTVDFSSDGFIRDSLEKINNNQERQKTTINLSRHLTVNKKPLDPYIVSIAVVNLNGKVVASDDKEWIGKDISDKDLFTQAKKNTNHDNIYIAHPHYINMLDKKCIFIHAHITSKDSGKSIGLIFNVFHLEALSNITTRQTELSGTGEVYIVDSNKMMITESRFINNASLEVMVDTEPVRKTIQNGEEMVGIYNNYRGVPIVGASVYIPEKGWTLLSEIDKSEAFAPLRFLGIVSLSMGLIIAALASVVGVLFAVSTSKPIKLLTCAAEKFADGNLDYRAKLNQKDEIGQLANSFNLMAEKLEKSGSILQESEERFRALAENIPEVFWMASSDLTRITYVSPTYKTIWGGECESLYRQPKSRMFNIHSEDNERIITALENHVKDKTGFSEEYRIVQPDGLIYWIRDRAFSIKTGSGITDHIVGIAENITERKKSEEQIRVSLEEKEVLLKEIHHRVKNNMQVISSLIKFQSENVKEERYIEMFEDCQNRIKAMSLIHEKLYRSKDLAKIKLADYVRNLIIEVFRSYKKNAHNIALNINIDDISIGIDTAIPCGLVVNELISNSLKYAFPDDRGGEIKISVHMFDSGEIELMFSDNGVGIPKDLDCRNTKSIGLKLIFKLTEHQLGGKVELDRSRGTALRIRFKEIEYRKRI